jgi:hypothetical protein
MMTNESIVNRESTKYRYFVEVETRIRRTTIY